MDRQDEPDLITRDADMTIEDHETHATTGGAAAAGAVTGGVIGLTGGPVGAVVGAVGGAIVGAAAERMMHSDDDSNRATTMEVTASTPTATRESINISRDDEDDSITR